MLDLTTMKKLTDIPVGKSPEGLTFTLDDAYLLVTSADADEIAVIDTTADEVNTTIVLDDDQPELKFWSPNSVSMDPIRSRAYVASADRNAVEVIDTNTWTISGYIPTAWYPVRVDISPDRFEDGGGQRKRVGQYQQQWQAHRPGYRQFHPGFRCPRRYEVGRIFG